jgi:hypothetical protein
VRVRGSSATSADDDEDVDEFLSSLGFEFVDARPANRHNDDGHNALLDGKSHLRFVVPSVDTRE